MKRKIPEQQQQQIKATFKAQINEIIHNKGFDVAIETLLDLIPVHRMRRKMICDCYKHKSSGQVSIKFGCHPNFVRNVCSKS